VAAHSILIVDDEFGLAEMLRDMLRDHGYEVVLAINGRLAFEVLGEQHIDLVVTDLMMPVMDGEELATAMRKSERYRVMPIIMMTSLPTAVPQQRELFDAILRKPFSPEQLLETVHGCLQKNPDAGANPAGSRQPGVA
jgi:DNA-binding response OmpR family regulator